MIEKLIEVMSHIKCITKNNKEENKLLKNEDEKLILILNVYKLTTILISIL